MATSSATINPDFARQYNEGEINVNSSERCRLLAVALAVLPQRDREIILLRYEGLTYEEIGRRLGRTQEAVIMREPSIYAKIRGILRTLGVKKSSDIL